MDNPNQMPNPADTSSEISENNPEQQSATQRELEPQQATAPHQTTCYHPPTKRKMPIWKKIAIGCGCAGAAFIVVSTAASLMLFSFGQVETINGSDSGGGTDLQSIGTSSKNSNYSTSGSSGSLSWGTDILDDADLGTSSVSSGSIGSGHGWGSSMLMETNSADSSSSMDSSLPTSSLAISEDAFDYEENKGKAPEEGGFISTKVQHLSTVSSDVDTASYANLRRAINNGDSRFNTDDVRIEEMLNYFDYDYELPSGNDKFTITKKVAECPWNEDTQLVSLGFTSAPETDTREKGSNLVFLIDVSGSMSDSNKLPLLQDSFATLVKHLNENDRISVITYSGKEDVVLEAVPGNEGDKIQKAIDGLKAQGATNGEAGMRMAYQIARDHYIEGGVNRIVMASDGDLNVGMDNLADLHDFVAKKKEQGIYLSVLGFGDGNYKDTAMETLADNGNGNYHYIDCVEEAERVLDERLMANLVPFANDVKIQIDFNAAQVKAYRLIGYENRTLAAEDFRDDTKDAGDVGPAQQFTVLYEVVPQTSALTPRVLGIEDEGDEKGRDSDEWMNVSMRYKMIGHSFFDFLNPDIREQEISVSAADEVKDPDNDWKFAAAVAQAGMAIKGSAHLNDATIGEAIVIAEQSTNNNALRKEFVDLMKRLDKAAFGSSYDKAVKEGIKKHAESGKDGDGDDSYLETRESKSGISKNS